MNLQNNNLEKSNTDLSFSKERKDFYSDIYNMKEIEIYRKKYEGLTDLELAKKLILEENKEDLVLNHIDNFNKKYHKTILELLKEIGYITKFYLE